MRYTEDFDDGRRLSRPQYFVVPVSYGETLRGIAFPPRVSRGLKGIRY